MFNASYTDTTRYQHFERSILFQSINKTGNSHIVYSKARH